MRHWHSLWETDSVIRGGPRESEIGLVDPIVDIYVVTLGEEHFVVFVVDVETNSEKTAL
jgi:hypothetical protein